MSLNRYLKSHTLQFYSVYQSDTAFLIILCKDSANERKESSLLLSRVQLVFCKDSANERKESSLLLSRVQPILCKDSANALSDKTKPFVFGLSPPLPHCSDSASVIPRIGKSPQRLGFSLLHFRDIILQEPYIIPIFASDKQNRGYTERTTVHPTGFIRTRQQTCD